MDAEKAFCLPSASFRPRNDSGIVAAQTRDFEDQEYRWLRAREGRCLSLEEQICSFSSFFSVRMMPTSNANDESTDLKATFPETCPKEYPTLVPCQPPVYASS